MKHADVFFFASKLIAVISWYTFMLVNAASRTAPARAAGRARGDSGESPDWTKDAYCTLYNLVNVTGRAAPARAAGRARGGSGESPDWTKDANRTFYTLVNAAGRAGPSVLQKKVRKINNRWLGIVCGP